MAITSEQLTKEIAELEATKPEGFTDAQWEQAIRDKYFHRRRVMERERNLPQTCI